MKVWHCVLFSFIVSFIIVSDVYCQLTNPQVLEARMKIISDNIQNEARSAVKTANDKEAEVINISAEMIKTKDFGGIPRVYELFGEVEQMADYWDKRARDDENQYKLGGMQRDRNARERQYLYKKYEISPKEYYAAEEADIVEKFVGNMKMINSSFVYKSVIPLTAQLRLTIGNVHKEAGQFDKARQVFRSVITNYTGTNYTSLVKKAEFALDDLKDFEKEWNIRAEKERAEKERAEKENQAKQNKSAKPKQGKKQQ
jgi:hypothetical protein